MPHIVIEHSTDGHGGLLDVPRLMAAVHDAAASTGVMKAVDIKVRSAAYENYLVARQSDGFCHVSVYLLAGRTPAQKIAVSEALRETMAALLPQTKSLSVDVRDMDPIAYRKRLND